jgi:hypothetical protein
VHSFPRKLEHLRLNIADAYYYKLHGAMMSLPLSLKTVNIQSSSKQLLQDLVKAFRPIPCIEKIDIHFEIPGHEQELAGVYKAILCNTRSTLQVADIGPLQAPQVLELTKVAKDNLHLESLTFSGFMLKGADGQVVPLNELNVLYRQMIAAVGLHPRLRNLQIYCFRTPKDLLHCFQRICCFRARVMCALVSTLVWPRMRSNGRILNTDLLMMLQKFLPERNKPY